MTIGYSSSYFDRFEARPSAAPPPPESVVAGLDEDAVVDGYDAALVLTSDEVAVLLAAEQALRGEFDAVNGIELTPVVPDIFTVADRRTGFLGVGRPADELDAAVPDDSPTAIGYRSGFEDNQAIEDRVAITDGPFTDGTTMQVSRLFLSLNDWYDRLKETCVHRMFGPEHAAEDVGEIGEHLGGQSRIDEKTAPTRRTMLEPTAWSGTRRKLRRRATMSSSQRCCAAPREFRRTSTDRR